MAAPDSHGSLLDQLRCRVPYTPVTALLIAINLIVFCAMLFHGAGLWHSPNSVQLAWGANFGPATEDGEWWRLLSALFLHFGLLHLAMNMLALWEGGMFVERIFGSIRFAIIYAVSGLSGNLLSLIAHQGLAVAGGASGAVLGTYGALLVYLWVSRRNLEVAEFRWLFGGGLAFAALTVALGIFISGIDNAAHIGGFLGGCLIGAFLLPQFATRYRAAALVLWLSAMVLLIASIPPPRYRWSDELNARNHIGLFLGEDQRISADWERLLSGNGAARLSFEQLASRIDIEVTERYEQTFEQLSSIHLEPAAPSARQLEVLRRYAELRRDASRNLADGLRLRDRQQVLEALKQARQAPARAGKSPEVIFSESGHE